MGSEMSCHVNFAIVPSSHNLESPDRQTKPSEKTVIPIKTLRMMGCKTPSLRSQNISPEIFDNTRSNGDRDCSLFHSPFSILHSPFSRRPTDRPQSRFHPHIRLSDLDNLSRIQFVKFPEASQPHDPLPITVAGPQIPWMSRSRRELS
jgi:hypothetical protein